MHNAFQLYYAFLLLVGFYNKGAILYIGNASFANYRSPFNKVVGKFNKIHHFF